MSGSDELNRISWSDGRTHFKVHWSGTQSLSQLDFKRLVTCFAAFLMPAEGVDENFESARDIFRFYHEQADYDTLSIEAAPTSVTGVIGEAGQRPPMVLVDC